MNGSFFRRASARIAMLGLAIAVSQTAQAQLPDSVTRWTVAASAGFNNPDGRMTQIYNPGLALDGMVEARFAWLQPIGFWADVNWNHLEGVTSPSSAQHSADFVQADIGIVYDIPKPWHTGGLRPYLLGGLGPDHVYSAAFRPCPDQVCGAWQPEGRQTLGFNALLGIGLGVPLGPVEWISEARYDTHPGAPSAFLNASFFQFQLGLRRVL